MTSDDAEPTVPTPSTEPTRVLPAEAPAPPSPDPVSVDPAPANALSDTPSAALTPSPGAGAAPLPTPGSDQTYRQNGGRSVTQRSFGRPQPQEPSFRPVYPGQAWPTQRPAYQPTYTPPPPLDWHQQQARAYTPAPPPKGNRVLVIAGVVALVIGLLAGAGARGDRRRTGRQQPGRRAARTADRQRRGPEDPQRFGLRGRGHAAAQRRPTQGRRHRQHQCDRLRLRHRRRRPHPDQQPRGRDRRQRRFDPDHQRQGQALDRTAGRPLAGVRPGRRPGGRPGRAVRAVRPVRPGDRRPGRGRDRFAARPGRHGHVGHHLGQEPPGHHRGRTRRERRSSVRCRPTPRSTRATRAARWST